MSTGFTESVLEEAALSWLEELGYAVLHGSDIAPGELYSERQGYADVVLVGRLQAAAGSDQSAELLGEEWAA